jgi:cysteine dioxygenase
MFMVLLQTRFGLDDLILKMMQMPYADLRLDQLRDWVATLHLSDQLFERHVSFSDRTYQRKLLCRTPRFDLLILCWQPGQSSTIHNHTDSLNVTRVYQGALTSRTFDRIGQTDQRCCLQAEETLGAGAIATVDRQKIHQLANTSDENLVTLHIYARPLKTMRVYSPDGRSQIISLAPDWLEECA